MRPKSAIISLSFLAMALAVIGAYFAFRHASAGDDRLTAEAIVKIENVEVRRAVDPIFGNEHTVDVSVAYEYEINGDQYHRTVRISASEAEAFVPWSTAKVCFDPGNVRTIKEGKLFPLRHKCGGG